MRATPQRVAILSAFTADCHSVTAEDIYKKVKNKKIDLATIYRTLASFEEKALIKKVPLGDGSIHYERGNSHHHHLVCTKCGLIEGFEMCGIEPLIKKALKESSQMKSVSGHSLELFGLCKKCSKGVK